MDPEEPSEDEQKDPDPGWDWKAGAGGHHAEDGGTPPNFL